MPADPLGHLGPNTTRSNPTKDCGVIVGDAHCGKTPAARAQKTYFIRCEGTGRVKIGKAIDPVARLAELQTGSSSPLTLVAVLQGDLERALHRDHAADRVFGEWFRYSAEVAASVEAAARMTMFDIRPLGGEKISVPAFAMPRSEAEAEWIAGACWHAALEGVDFKGGVATGDIAVPDAFLPIGRIVTTLDAYQDHLREWRFDRFDVDGFALKYPGTYADLIRLAKSRGGPAKPGYRSREVA